MTVLAHLLALTVSGGILSTEAAAAPYCKPTPGSATWPSADDWQALNQSVNGQLLAPTPPAGVCYPSRPEYSNASCTALLASWTNASWHAENPWTSNYNDDTCLPDPSGSAPCSTTGYPAYVINATSAADIQAGVRFAKKTGVRLIVKGTGHDFPGRSAGAGSLSIWTHHLLDMSYTPSEPRAVQYGGVGAVKVAAGVRMLDMYSFAAQHNITLIGGGGRTVGIGGWTLGGGHGPLTAKYGLGADQVLEMEVVTADGELRTVNENSEPELFWALRGGGALTFGILVTVTIKAYPPLSLAQVNFQYNTTADSDTFWSMVALFHSHIPRLSESGLMGYYYVTSNVTGEVDPTKQAQFQGFLSAPLLTGPQAMAIFNQFDAAINASNFPDPVTGGAMAIEIADFSAEGAKASGAEPVGTDGRLGSRLLDGNALSKDMATLKLKLRQSLPQPFTLLGHIVAGPGARNALIPGGSNAVLPAWRKTYTHVVLPRSWPPLNETAKTAINDVLRNTSVQALRDLAPDTGAYVSEADPTEPSWQEAFWGAHYPRLLELKKKWDPEGVFWCKPCVGSELWTVSGGDGIGQSSGTICRV